MAKKLTIFLSHNSADKPAVEALALRLRQEPGIETWLDAEDLLPGASWQVAIQHAIATCDVCAVFVGPNGFGDWQRQEMEMAIDRRVTDPQRKFRVIPVLLPGAERGSRSALPKSLVSATWVEFRRTLEDKTAWQRLLFGIRGEKSGPPPDGRAALAECPYRGLEFFDVAHADRFFGREAVTQWLVDDIRKPLRPGNELPRFLAILGASGSGKSSLARAGLYATLRDGAIEGSRDWLFVAPLRPGPNPLESLELALLQAAAGSPQLEAVRHELRELADKPDRLHRAARLLVADTSPPRRLFLLVDQFEEVFTTCEKEELRRAFIAALLHAARERGGPVVVALTMRADFYPKVAAYEELARVVDQHQYLVGPMNEAELRLAIEEPALRAGAEFEPGLVDTLLADVHRQPGALPLLQHALLELWNKREEGRRLTHESYRKIGGLEGALERRANEIFRQFSAEEQELCRRVFLRLVHPGDGAEDTKRRVQLRELLALGGKAQQPRIEKLLATLTAPDSRLVVTEGGDKEHPGQASVEVAHEMLIGSWSQLRKWLDADRTGMRTQRRLTEAAREWEENGRKTDFLYSGGRLAVAREWADKHDGELTSLETEFLQASQLQETDEQAEELHQERERADLAEKLAAAEREKAESATRLAAEAQARAAEQKRTADKERERAALAEQMAKLEVEKAATSARLASEAQALAQERERAAALDRERADTAEKLRQESATRAADNQRAATKARKQSRFLAAVGTVALASALITWVFYGRANLDRIAAAKSAETAKSALTETRRQLERAQIEEGRTWVERAKLDLSRGNNFAAAMKAARAIGFVNYGREQITNSKLLNNLTVLLTVSNAPSDEATAQAVLATALSPVDSAIGMPIWQSPVTSSQAIPVSTVAFSPDGRAVASGAADGTVKLWLVSSGKEVATFRGHTTIVTSVAFSPDGKTVASGSGDKTVKLWETGSGMERTTFLGHTSGVTSVAFSPDGKTVASGSWDHTVKLWEADGGKERTIRLGGEFPALCVAFSPDGKTLASGGTDLGTVTLWRTDSWQESATFSEHAGLVTGVAFSPDGKSVATAESLKVKLWEAGSGKELATFGKDPSRLISVLSFAISPDGKSIVSGFDDGTVTLWRTGSREEMVTFRGHKEKVTSVAFSPDGEVVASGSDDGMVKLWEAGSGKELPTFWGRQHLGRSLAFNPNLKTAISGSILGAVEVWEASSGTRLATFRGHTNEVTSIAISPDGQTVVSGSWDSTVWLWDAGSGKHLATCRGHTNRVNGVAFSPDGKIVASGGEDNTVRLWEAGSGKELAICSGHTEAVKCVAYSPDGKTIASGAGDKTVRLWDAHSGRELAELKGHWEGLRGVAFSRDGKLASASDDRTVTLWELGSRRSMINLRGHLDGVLSVAFSPDGKTLASGSRDKTVKLWDAGNGKELATLRGQRAGVLSVAFSPDGKTLASGSWESVKVWGAEIGKQWNLAAYLQGWMKLEGSELLWLNPADNLPEERQFPVLNAPPGSLVALYGKELSETRRRADCLAIFLRAQNWPATVRLWGEIVDEDPPELPLRETYVLCLTANAAEDVASGVLWRAEWLAREALTNCTAEVLQSPAVSLATLRLARELNTSTNADFAPLREECLPRLRTLAPPTWQEALAAQPKTDQATEAGSKK